MWSIYIKEEAWIYKSFGLIMSLNPVDMYCWKDTFTVKKRIKGLITMQPFQKLCLTTVRDAVLFSVLWLYFFLPKGGVSQLT
jgi:hypothetical protein